MYSYDALIRRAEESKKADFMSCERLKHVIFAKQFSKEILEQLSEVADKIRTISSTKEGYLFLTSLLPHKRAMLYFTQASTRTFLSFTAALQILGITCNEIRDPSVSSEYKGEDPIDSVRMFSSYFDIIIMRSKIPNFAERCAYLMNDLGHFNKRNVPIVNGGAGADEHPTQALLDIYTILREFSFNSETDSTRWTYFDELQKKYPDLTKGLGNKTYCFCGDIGRGRTVRSLVNLLSLYDNNVFYFVSPTHEKFRLSPNLKEVLQKKHKVFETEELNEVIEKVDMLYMTRIQHEHDSPEDVSFFNNLEIEKFYLSPEKAKMMKDYAIILHPFPRNKEIPFEIDNDHRSKYFEQARNGMWARAALIAYLFDVDSKILRFYEQNYTARHDYNINAL